MRVDTRVLQVKPQAVVRVNEDRINLLLAHDLLHEYHQVRVAVHLIVADDREVILYPLVCVLAFQVVHA